MKSYICWTVFMLILLFCTDSVPQVSRSAGLVYFICILNEDSILLFISYYKYEIFYLLHSVYVEGLTC